MIKEKGALIVSIKRASITGSYVIHQGIPSKGLCICSFNAAIAVQGILEVWFHYVIKLRMNTENYNSSSVITIEDFGRKLK